MSLITSLRKEWIELARTSRLLVLVIVLGFFGLSSPLLARYTPEIFTLIPGAEDFAGLIPPPSVVDAVGQYVKNTSQFGVLLALLLSMGLVSREKERGTAALVLSKPLPRSSFLLSKFLALGLAFALALLVAGLGGYYYTLVLFEATNILAWLVMNGALLLLFLVYIAITLLFSTLLRSQAAAAGIGLAFVLLFSVLSALPTLNKFIPDQLVSWSASSVLGGSQINPLPPLISALALIAVSLLAACLVFKKQEL